MEKNYTNFLINDIKIYIITEKKINTLQEKKESYEEQNYRERRVQMIWEHFNPLWSPGRKASKCAQFHIKGFKIIRLNLIEHCLISIFLSVLTPKLSRTIIGQTIILLSPIAGANEEVFTVLPLFLDAINLIYLFPTMPPSLISHHRKSF